MRLLCTNTNKDDRCSVLVLIPKKRKRGQQRNLLRRRTKEVFRRALRDITLDYLIKFSKFTEGFEDNLEDFFKNV